MIKNGQRRKMHQSFMFELLVYCVWWYLINVTIRLQATETSAKYDLNEKFGRITFVENYYLISFEFQVLSSNFIKKFFFIAQRLEHMLLNFHNI